MGHRGPRQHRRRHRRGGPCGSRRAGANPNRKEPDMSLPNIVLVHGAWADGSCWSDVIEKLQAKGYKVTAPQFPMSSLANDVARLRQVLALQGGPTIVAGHSYGGQIMTALGTDAQNVVGSGLHSRVRNRPGRVAGRQTVSGASDASTGARVHGQTGLHVAVRGRFRKPLRCRRQSIRRRRSCMPSSNRWPGRDFGDVMGVPAWKSLPTWYMVAANDETILPDAEEVRQADGGDRHRSEVQPRGDDFAPETGPGHRPLSPDGRVSGRCRCDGGWWPGPR